MSRVAVSWVFAIMLALFGGTVASAETRAGAAALEARLLAPCCYGGTLDTHESELARELRKEIEVRLAGGESSESVQADFVARYGERVVAARSDKPIRAMGLSLLGLMGGTAIGLAVMLRRWLRRGKGRVSPIATLATESEFDQRLDAELADMD